MSKQNYFGKSLQERLTASRLQIAFNDTLHRRDYAGLVSLLIQMEYSSDSANAMAKTFLTAQG